MIIRPYPPSGQIPPGATPGEIPLAGCCERRSSALNQFTHPQQTSIIRNRPVTTSTQQAPVLTFGDKQYAVDSLSDTAKEAVAGLQVAEAQIRMTQDQIKVLAIGRQALMGQLEAELAGVEPITAE